MLESGVDVLVRDSMPADAEPLAALFRSSWELAYQGIIPQPHLGASGEKAVENFTANTQAAFDAAQAIASASTIPEAAKLQADFFQQQLATAGAQTKEFFELSTKLTQETFQTMNSATAKTFEQFKGV